MNGDVKKWLFNLVDDKVQVNNLKIVCDENNTIFWGIALDRMGDKFFLSARDSRITLALIADKEQIPLNTLLQLDNHSVVKFIRVNKVDIIKKMYLVVDEFNNIYKMLIIDGNEDEYEIINKEEKINMVKKFAFQHAITIQELQNMPLKDLEITKITNRIKKIDVIVDEWKLSSGPCVEKIFVLTNDGSNLEYRDIDDIRRMFIALCRQECANSQKYVMWAEILKNALRNDFLTYLKNMPLINVIKPIYERIEVIERSTDSRNLPIKVKITTSNHGIQVYDLLNGVLISNTNQLVENNLLQKIRKIIKKCSDEEVDSLYEIEKYFSLLLKNMDLGEFELEESFFVKYFAKQQLIDENVQEEIVGSEDFARKLKIKQKSIAKNLNGKIKKA